MIENLWQFLKQYWICNLLYPQDSPQQSRTGSTSSSPLTNSVVKEAANAASRVARGDAKSLSDLFSNKTKAIVWGMQTRAVQVSILWNEGSKHSKTVSLQVQNTLHPFVNVFLKNLSRLWTCTLWILFSHWLVLVVKSLYVFQHTYYNFFPHEYIMNFIVPLSVRVIFNNWNFCKAGAHSTLFWNRDLTYWIRQLCKFEVCGAVAVYCVLGYVLLCGVMRSECIEGMYCPCLQGSV